MQKNLPLLIGGLVIAGAIGAFLLLRQPGGPATMMGGGGKETVSSSFADLMKMGKDYQCTFTTTDETAGTTNGTVYVADQGANFSGTFLTQPTTGAQSETHMVRSGDYSYIWTTGQAQGYKMKIDPESEELFDGGDDDKNEQIVIDENAAMDFNCEAWRPQASMFTVPSDIEFVDFSAQVEMMQQYTVPTSTDESDDNLKCGVCTSLEGDNKASCLAAMGC